MPFSNFFTPYNWSIFFYAIVKANKLGQQDNKMDPFLFFLIITRWILNHRICGPVYYFIVLIFFFPLAPLVFVYFKTFF